MAAGRRLKILYGVHGYGRGHAARAQAILPELTGAYDVLVLAGDEAYDQLHKDYRVVRIPTLRYWHNNRGRRSAWRTIMRNAPAVLDLLLEGPIFQMVRDEIRRFEPDAAVSDSEGWTHRAAGALGIPRISFDHYGILAYCPLKMSPWDRLICWLESLVYRMLVCKPEHIIVTAFYRSRPGRPGRVKVVGPILREQVRRTRPSAGDHLLVYFANASVHFTPRVEQALRALACRVKAYGPDRRGVAGNIEFCRIADLPFVRDLASCRAVFSTAGNQLISEAIHFGKPLLLMPERSLEQRLNAQFVHSWEIGMRTSPREVTAELLRRFLGCTDEFAGNIGCHRRDGLAEALAAINEAVVRLGLTRRRNQ